MQNTLFSNYKQQENQVTAAIIAVLERLGTSTLELVLGNLIEESDFRLVEFKNQVKDSGKSRTIPDAMIFSGFSLAIETKLERNKVTENQLVGHLKFLPESGFCRLVILTPDTRVPSAIQKKGDNRIVWSSFERFVQIIEEIIADRPVGASDIELFLVDELIKYILSIPNLIGQTKKNEVVIIPAANAYSVYKTPYCASAGDKEFKYGVYICQINRYFNLSEYMGFYCNQRIQKEIPLILGWINDLSIDHYKKQELKRFRYIRNNCEDWIHNAMLDLKKNMYPGIDKMTRQTIFILTSHDDMKNTEILDSEIENVKKSNSGGNTAWVRKQRYIDLRRLKDVAKSNPFTSSLG